MSIPMRSLQRARALRAHVGEHSPRRCSITTAGCPKAGLTGPTPPAPAGARCATPASIFWWRHGRPDAIALAARQYDPADNMTDRMAALATLSHCDVPERAAALDDFYARYADDPLIIDKWLSLQAADSRAGDARPRQGAHQRIRAFRFANPNRVRALIHAFAHGEPEGVQPRRRRGLRLHRRHGAGARSQESAACGAAACPRSRAGACSSRPGARWRKPPCSAWRPRRRSPATSRDIVQRALAEVDVPR